MYLSTYIESNKSYIEKTLERYILSRSGLEQPVYEAMTYSLMAGGKRLRPMIMLEVYRLFSEDTSAIEGFMTAIEMIHTYSLIHDDLPAMDDDDLRRGKPTCHIKFGEDIAILAGDGLLNMAFEVMIDTVLNRNLGRAGLKAMQCLGKKSGTRGMVGGQVVDIISEGKQIDLDTVMYIHTHKTAALIEAAFMIGAYVGGADDDLVSVFQRIGYNVGMAFQIQDDLLDVLSTEDKLGKPINSDADNNKTTYIDIKGEETSRLDIKSYLDEADQLTSGITVGDTAFIRSLIEYIRNRDY